MATVCCTMCGQDRDESQFYFHKKTGALLQWCKPCRKIYSRRRYEENGDEIRAKQSQYRAANRDEVNAKLRALYAANRDDIKKNNQAYRRSRTFTIETYLRRFLKTKFYKCRKAGIEFTLDVPYVLDLYNQQNGKCALTGRVMTWREKIRDTTHVDSHALSIDRIDQSQGYVPGNVRLTIAWANFSRGALDDDTLYGLAWDMIDVMSRTRQLRMVG